MLRICVYWLGVSKIDIYRRDSTSIHVIHYNNVKIKKSKFRETSKYLEDIIYGHLLPATLMTDRDSWLAWKKNARE